MQREGAKMHLARLLGLATQNLVTFRVTADADPVVKVVAEYQLLHLPHTSPPEFNIGHGVSREALQQAVRVAQAAAREAFSGQAVPAPVAATVSPEEAADPDVGFPAPSPATRCED